MADISQIILPNGNTYDIKDTIARQTAGGGLQFKGVTTTAITDGASTSTYSIGGNNITASNGDLVVYGSKEFLFSTSDNKWHELGDNTDLGDLAYQDTASGYLPKLKLTADVVPSTTSKYVASSATGGGTVTNGTAASCTLPTWSASVQGETLTISWSSGSWTANTPTAVTLPTFSSQTIATGISTQPTVGYDTTNSTTTISVS